MLRSADRWRFALTPRVVDEPGADWNYNGGCTELLGAIVRKATGEPIDKFAQDTLFASLGIADATWFRYLDGIPGAASGLRLRSRDLARIGQFVLQRGQSAISSNHLTREDQLRYSRCRPCPLGEVSRQWSRKSVRARFTFNGVHKPGARLLGQDLTAQLEVQLRGGFDDCDLWGTATDTANEAGNCPASRGHGPPWPQA